MKNPPQATPFYLQDAMVDEIKNLMKDLIFETPSGEKSSLNVFCQNLPTPRRAQEDEMVEDSYDEIESYGEEDSFFFPWCLVKIDSGGVKEPNGPQTTTLIVVFGIYDGTENHTGYQKILTMFQRIIARFSENPVLAKQFTQQGEINWAIQDDDDGSASGIGTGPYQFGAMMMEFRMSGHRREDKFT